jgi:integrase
MELYKRPNSPYWWATFSVDGEGRRRISTKRENRRDAEKVAAALLKEALDATQLGIRKTMTAAEAVYRWIESVGKTHADHDRYLIRANRLIDGRARAADGTPVNKGKPRLKEGDPLPPPARVVWHLGREIALHRVDTAKIEELKAARLQEGYAANTINREIALLQVVINHARSKWKIKVAPDVEFEKLETKGKLRWFTPEEANAVLAELEPKEGDYKELKEARQDAWDLAVFLLDTGARYSEVSETPWEVVEPLDARKVNLYRNKVGNEASLEMTDRLYAMLKRRKKATNSPYIFPHRLRPDEPRGYAPKAIRKAMERANVNAPHKVKRYGKATIHTFRDTFASWLVQKDVSLYTVQLLLGHASPQMTQKYAHLAPNEAAKTAARVLNQIHAEGAAAT